MLTAFKVDEKHIWIKKLSVKKNAPSRTRTWDHLIHSSLHYQCTTVTCVKYGKLQIIILQNWRTLKILWEGERGEVAHFQQNPFDSHMQRDTYIESHPALQLRRLGESGLRSTRKEIVRKLSRVSSLRVSSLSTKVVLVCSYIFMHCMNFFSLKTHFSLKTINN